MLLAAQVAVLLGVWVTVVLGVWVIDRLYVTVPLCEWLHCWMCGIECAVGVVGVGVRWLLHSCCVVTWCYLLLVCACARAHTEFRLFSLQCTQSTCTAFGNQSMRCKLSMPVLDLVVCAHACICVYICACAEVWIPDCKALPRFAGACRAV